MSAVTVDASVWIAAVDTADAVCGQSRAFLAGAVQRGVQLIIPAFAVTEVACALARKHRNAAVARQLTGSMLTPVLARGCTGHRIMAAVKPRT